VTLSWRIYAPGEGSWGQYGTVINNLSSYGAVNPGTGALSYWNGVYWPGNSISYYYQQGSFQVSAPSHTTEYIVSGATLNPPAGAPDDP
jgi:hypothetical protein